MTGWLRRHVGHFFFSLAVACMLAGAACGYYFFYRLGPKRRMHDMRWDELQSNKARWLEAQASIERGEWFHDIGFRVGECGDEAWARRILADLQPGGNIGCSGGH